MTPVSQTLTVFTVVSLALEMSIAMLLGGN